MSVAAWVRSLMSALVLGTVTFLGAFVGARWIQHVDLDAGTVIGVVIVVMVSVCVIGLLVDAFRTRS